MSKLFDNASPTIIDHIVIKDKDSNEVVYKGRGINKTSKETKQ